MRKVLNAGHRLTVLNTAELASQIERLSVQNEQLKVADILLQKKKVEKPPLKKAANKQGNISYTFFKKKDKKQIVRGENATGLMSPDLGFQDKMCAQILHMYPEVLKSNASTPSPDSGTSSFTFKTREIYELKPSTTEILDLAHEGKSGHRDSGYKVPKMEFMNKKSLIKTVQPKGNLEIIPETVANNNNNSLGKCNSKCNSRNLTLSSISSSPLLPVLPSGGSKTSIINTSTSTPKQLLNKSFSPSLSKGARNISLEKKSSSSKKTPQNACLPNINNK